MFLWNVNDFIFLFFFFILNFFLNIFFSVYSLMYYFYFFIFPLFSIIFFSCKCWQNNRKKCFLYVRKSTQYTVFYHIQMFLCLIFYFISLQILIKNVLMLLYRALNSFLLLNLYLNLNWIVIKALYQTFLVIL